MKQQLIRLAVAYKRYPYLSYKKIDKNKYMYYCFNCQKYETVDYKTIQQIQMSHLCPRCHTHIQSTTKQEIQQIGYVRQNDIGYQIGIKFEFGKEPICTGIYEVAKWKINRNGKEVISVRYIMLPMWYSEHLTVVEYRGKWSKWRKNDRYMDYFIEYEDVINNPEHTKTRKEYYEELEDKESKNFAALKSNQQKIIKSNLLTIQQINAIQMFDLKSFDELKKYRKYIEYECRYWYDIQLNIYYLDYLNRNNIRLHDYLDYMKQCKMLEIKPEKPKDFYKVHDKLSQQIKSRNDEFVKSGCKERYKQLEKYKYSKNDIQIKPFATTNEIEKCGKQLHNCIASNYMEDYAFGNTDLYHLDENGKMKVAIEVCNSELMQALMNLNKDCTPEYKKIITKWCEINKFSLGDAFYEY